MLLEETHEMLLFDKLSQIAQNSIGNCDCAKFNLCIVGGHFDYSPLVLKSLDRTKMFCIS